MTASVQNNFQGSTTNNALVLASSSKKKQTKVTQSAPTNDALITVAKAAVVVLAASQVAQVAGAPVPSEPNLVPRHFYFGNQPNYDQCNANWMSATRYKYINFNAPGDANNTYEIATPWTLSYPGKLRKGLTEEGFEVLNHNPVGSCGWSVADKVWGKGVERGWIEFQSANGLLAQPNETSLNAVQQVLLKHYPSLELGLLLGFTLGTVGAVVVGACIFACANG